MHKTAAVHAARSYCTIYGHDTYWVVIGPSTDPTGPSSEVRASSYAAALRIRAGWRAEIALRLMGEWSELAAYDINRAVFDPYGPTDLAKLVNIGLSALSRA